MNNSKLNLKNYANNMEKPNMYAEIKVEIDLQDLCDQLLANLTSAEIEYVYHRMRDWIIT